MLSVAVRDGDAHYRPNYGGCAAVAVVRYRQHDLLSAERCDGLEIGKDKILAYRATLIEFGKRHCGIDNPDLIINSIIEAAHAYVSEIEPGEIWDQMRAQIEIGCSTLAAAN